MGGWSIGSSIKTATDIGVIVGRTMANVAGERKSIGSSATASLDEFPVLPSNSSREHWENGFYRVSKRVNVSSREFSSAAPQKTPNQLARTSRRNGASNDNYPLAEG